MSADQQLDFLLLANVHGFFFNPLQPDGLTFRAEAPPANILIKPARDGSGLIGLECRAYGSRAVAAELRAFATDLIDGRFRMYSEAPIKLPLVRDKKQLIDASGELAKGFSPPLNLYPPALQSVCEEVAAELRSEVERFFKLLRVRLIMFPGLIMLWRFCVRAA